MGLMVLFCFLQVFLVIPHALCVWDCIFLRLENFVYYLPCTLLGRRRSRYNALRGVGPVQMSNLLRNEEEGDDDDSGINSVSSNSDNASNDSGDVIGIGNPDDNEGGDTSVLIVREERRTVVEVVPAIVVHEDDTFERRVTAYMQKCMLYLSVCPMALHLLFGWYRSRSQTRNRWAVWWLFHILVSLGVLFFVLGVSVGLLVQLRFTNQPPQFFHPDSNIQKMLNLAGNVTDLSAGDCYDQCSAWSGGGDSKEGRREGGREGGGEGREGRGGEGGEGEGGEGEGGLH
jgi:hypothetical protein